MPDHDSSPPGVASPCIGTCKLDGATGWCLGCGRTISEIVEWRDADDADRAAVLKEAAGRLMALRLRAVMNE